MSALCSFITTVENVVKNHSFLESTEISQSSQVHNGFLNALLAAAVSLQGDQCVEVEPRVAVMRRRRVRVSAARRLRPTLVDVAAADVI